MIRRRLRANTPNPSQILAAQAPQPGAPQPEVALEAADAPSIPTRQLRSRRSRR
jgi:hypothetical protein